MTIDKNKLETNNINRMVAGLDINKLISKAQEAYGKKEGGLSKQLTTGSSLARSTKDTDFVIWDKGDHWKQLTSLIGIPFGRIVQISGKPDSGKSTHAACFMKAAQDQGHLVILWDAEKKFSPSRFDNQIKGNSDNLVIIDTNSIINGAKAVAHIIHAAKEQNPKCKILICWDSVGSSVNSNEDSDEDEDFSKQPGVDAKEIGYAIRKFNKLSNRYINRLTGEDTIATLIINQTYANIGSVGQVEKGGGALYYLSSLIIQLSRKQDLTRIKSGEKYKYGIVTRARVKKNHLFSGEESIAEMDLVISSDGIQLAKEVKKNTEIKGWDEQEDEVE